MDLPSAPRDSYAAARAAMVDSLRPHVQNERVLDAFARVPRERFVIPELRGRAYDDAPLSIGYGQTISQPLVVAIMLDLLSLTGAEKVLDVGTGSGYQAALLSLLARTVVGVERIPELAASAASALEENGYLNVTVHIADKALGWPDDAPYDAIVVGAAAPGVPDSLVDQLAEGGRLVLPVGTSGEQELTLVEKGAAGVTLSRKGAVRFVPLLGPGAFCSSPLN